MDTLEAREQAWQEAQAALAARHPELCDEAGDVEQGCEYGWDYAEAHPEAPVEEIRQEAARVTRERGYSESFRLSFISAALGGVEGLIR